MPTESKAERLAMAYDHAAESYRRDDEIELLSENHQRLGGNLRRICQSFPSPIRVMEIGCGTGRYFHWLNNTALLVGTDISARMLEQAKAPIRGSAVSRLNVRLIQQDIYTARFDDASFDFVYALGVFGYGMEFTAELGANIYRWLAPGGRVYFDAIEELPRGPRDRLKAAVKRLVSPYLPANIEALLRGREPLPVYYHRREALERRMSAAGFTDFTLSSNTCKSPLWTGSHIECIARKSAGQSRRDNLELASRSLSSWQSN